MGNKSSVATIVASVDQLVITTGSVVKGTVYLQVDSSDGVSCSSICSRLTGLEETEAHFREALPEAGKENTVIKREVKERKAFLKTDFTLAAIPAGKIKKGRYEYPFSFTIPNGAPPSMIIPCGHRDACRTSYTLEVWLKRPGMMKSNFKSKTKLVVVNPAPAHKKTPLYMEPLTKPLQSMWCISRGNVLLGGLVESTILTAGETVTVRYAAINHSSVAVMAIEISLKEIVTFHSGAHHGKGLTTMLFMKKLSPRSADLDLRPILRTSDNLDLRVLSGMLDSNRHKVTIPILPNARNTFNGKLISVKTVLTIKARTQYGTSNPRISCNIQMHSSNLDKGTSMSIERPHGDDEASVPETVPEDWDPVVASPVTYPPVSLYEAPSAPSIDEAEANYEDDHNSINISIRSHEKGFDALEDGLRGCTTPCGELDRWLKDGNNPDELKPDQFYTMFLSVKDPFEQMRFAEALAASMTTMTCQILARAAAGCKEASKREVVEKLLAAGPLVDKSKNVRLVKDELTPFQFMTLEKYFQ